MNKQVLSKCLFGCLVLLSPSLKVAGRRLKAEGVTPRSSQRFRLYPRLSYFICAVLLLTSKVEGGRKLREYLAAPASIQDAFDKRVDEAIRKSLEAERAVADEVGDDPLATRHVPAEPIGVAWDERWSKRAKWKPKPTDKFQPYSREVDPLLDLDLRTVWEQLTGFDLRGEASRCPLPDHDDSFPSCGVKENFWRCNRCDVGGSLIDLGAVLYGLEPRGQTFHLIRERLLADLGMDDRRAA